MSLCLSLSLTCENFKGFGYIYIDNHKNNFYYYKLLLLLLLLLLLFLRISKYHETVRRNKLIPKYSVPLDQLNGVQNSIHNIDINKH